MMGKTVAIGDVHGRKQWQAIVDKYPDAKIVFMGDYVDPYEYFSNDELLDNMRKIIDFKKQNMDRVVLLLGNHDMHYISSDFHPCWRFSPSIAEEYAQLINENIGLFTYAYQEGNRIFTHAGVTEQWFTKIFHGDRQSNIADQINSAIGDQRLTLAACSWLRGGYDNDGGPFWADIEEIYNDPLVGYHQVVGHNRVNAVCTKTVSPSTSITFCDCLDMCDYLVLDCEETTSPNITLQNEYCL